MIRRRIRSKLQKVLLHDKSGMTLVELMVTFLLLGILMAAAIATLSPAMNVMARISNMSRAQGVADILMEKVCGEVGSSTWARYRSTAEMKRFLIPTRRGARSTCTQRRQTEKRGWCFTIRHLR